MSSPILQIIKQISEEKHIPFESVIETIEAALAAAFRKDFGEKNQNIKVKYDAETGDFEVFDAKTVVEDIELTPEELAALEEEERPRYRDDRPHERRPERSPTPDAQNPDAPVKRFNPKTEIMVTRARETLKKEAEVGEEIRTRLEVPTAFGRMAAQTAKQVIIQKLREAERNKLFIELKERERELITATVQRREGKNVLVDVGSATATLPPEEQIPTERYAPGDRIKVLVLDVRMSTRGPEVIVSRAHPDIIPKLFAVEIPEIATGIVLIHAVAREAGARAKVAVSSTQENVDPIGSCIGQRGTRIQTVIGEMGGEKIDIIQHDADPATFIGNALSPAKVQAISLREVEKVADVKVKNDQLSLAIGRGGQNVRLASHLTGWKINILEAEGGSAVTVDEAVVPVETASVEAPAQETPAPTTEEPKA